MTTVLNMNPLWVRVADLMPGQKYATQSDAWEDWHRNAPPIDEHEVERHVAALTKLAERHGYAVIIDSVKLALLYEGNNFSEIYGLTDHTKRVVAMRDDLSRRALISVLAHEVGHVLLRSAGWVMPGVVTALLYGGTDPVHEIVAETLTHVYHLAHGLERPVDLPAAYIAGYALAAGAGLCETAVTFARQLADQMAEVAL